jgi:hypothetical protein
VIESRIVQTGTAIASSNDWIEKATGLTDVSMRVRTEPKMPDGTAQLSGWIGVVIRSIGAWIEWVMPQIAGSIAKADRLIAGSIADRARTTRGRRSC